MIAVSASTAATIVEPWAAQYPIVSIIGQVIVVAMLLISGVFGLVGSYGLVKLPDPMTRLHAPTKAATLGVGGALLASMTFSLFFLGHMSWHELLIALFLFLTAPITGHMIAKAHMHRSWKGDEMPRPSEGHHWATFGDSGEASVMDLDEVSEVPSDRFAK